MVSIDIGDRVRIKDRIGWPTPPGYRLANTEGVVIKVYESEEILEEFQDYLNVRIEKTEADVKPGAVLPFRKDDLQKI
jgi:hypothetical protein